MLGALQKQSGRPETQQALAMLRAELGFTLEDHSRLVQTFYQRKV
jgi:hypothetical protein